MKSYEGSLGKFQYDESEFELSVTDDNVEYLKYIGSETDGANIKIPEGITDVSYMFEGSDITSQPAVPDGVKHADYMCFNCDKLKIAGKLPEGLESMDSCYSECHNLESAPYMPDTVKSAEFAYDGATSLMNFPNFSKSLEDATGMLANCSKLEHIPAFPDTLKRAEAICLNDTALKSMPDVPATCERIDYGFAGCENIEELKSIPKSVSQEEVFTNGIDFDETIDDDFEDLKEIENAEKETASKTFNAKNTKDFIASRGQVYKAAAEVKVHDGRELDVSVSADKSSEFDIGK